MTYELKRCPYCGGKARIHQSDIGGAQVLCAECGCGTQYSYWKLEYAIAAWNRRAQDAPNPPLTLEPCWCRDCKYCYLDIDEVDGTKCLRCRNDISWFNHEIVRDKNTCGECERRKPEEPKHTTHADRFHSMTNEELAVTLPCPNEMGLADIPCDHGDDKNCCACLLDWLNKPEEKI